MVPRLKTPVFPAKIAISENPCHPSQLITFWAYVYPLLSTADCSIKSPSFIDLQYLFGSIDINSNTYLDQ